MKRRVMNLLVRVVDALEGMERSGMMKGHGANGLNKFVEVEARKTTHSCCAVQKWLTELETDGSSFSGSSSRK